MSIEVQASQPRVSKPFFQEKLSGAKRAALLEPRTDRPGKDSSFLRTMVLDKEEGE